MNEALWLLGRGTGVAAFQLLTLSLGLGVLTAGRRIPPRRPGRGALDGPTRPGQSTGAVGS